VKSNWTCIINILHRALRILPSFLFVLLIYYNFYPQISEGLLWRGDKNLQRKCFPLWKVWTFSDNYYKNGTEQCYLIGWYLDVDMQLYALSMVVLLIYKYSPLTSKLIIGISSVLGLYQTFAYVQKNKILLIVHAYDSRFVKSYDVDQYMKPWQWIPTYFFGLFMGMLYF
jgi:peptidoglycan/LPS O-acetylase OafA/YrhL